MSDASLRQTRSPDSATVRSRVSAAFGVTADSRRQTLEGMRRKTANDRVVYWFQLALATGIAIFGLELNSPGVVIGAMLIAPLMEPIVELAMSLTVADARLLVRSFFTITVSLTAVIAAGSVVARLLPFTAASPEILARTSPTLLDLCVAVLCALTAAFTTVRASSSAATTAAGTSIGISLVPPLCVVGFGFGVGDVAIARGAMLLFTANFCAILLCASLFFAAVGFRSQRHTALEQVADARTWTPFARLAAIIESGLHSQWRALWRVGVPVALFAAVSVPLTQALGDVAWQVRTRAAVNDIIAAEPALQDAISVHSQVEPESLTLRAVIVGDDASARVVEQQIAAQLAPLAPQPPVVHVRAVPPSLARETRARPVETVAESIPEAARRLAARLDSSLEDLWPRATAAGTIVGRKWSVDRGNLTFVVVHDGAAMNDAARADLDRQISAHLAMPVTVETISTATMTAATDAELPAWWDRAQTMIGALELLPQWRACVTAPAADRRQSLGAYVHAALASKQAQLEPLRMSVNGGPQWSVSVRSAGCDDIR